MKYCSNCGAKLDDDARFCGECGTPFAADAPAAEPEVQDTPAQQPVPQETPVEQPVSQETPAEQPVSQEEVPQADAPQAPVSQEPTPKAPRKPSKFGAFVKKHVAVLSIVAVLLVAAIGTGIYFLTRPTTIKLNDYITVEYVGYDGFGMADYSFDKEAFEEDYGSKLKMKKPKQSGLAGILDSLASPVDLFGDLCVGGRLDKYENLKNGDEIHYTWSCDDETAMELFHVRLSYEDIPFTVEGLEEVKEVDPFADLEITFSETAPYGEVDWDYISNEDYADSFYFNISPDSSLKNGDTITVSLEDGKDQDWQRYIAETYGIAVTKTEQTYTVEGLDSYVTDLSQLTEETKAAIDTKVQAYMKDQSKNVEGELTISTPERVGFYLLNSKEPLFFGDTCQIYGIYKVTAADIQEEGSETAPEEFTYYFAMGFSDPLIHADGTTEIDLEDYDIPYSRMTRQWNGYSYFFTGYETLEKFEEKVIKPDEDTYTYKTDITK